MKAIFLKPFIRHIRLFWNKSEATLWKQFFPSFFVCFFILSSKMFRNICKLRVKLPNTTIYPSYGPKKKTYSSLIWNAKHVAKVTFERCWGEESLIWKIKGLTNYIFVKSEFVRCIFKKWVGNHFYMAKGTLIYFNFLNYCPSSVWILKS